MTENLNYIAVNQPMYLYRTPMFAITVSTVILVENKIIILEKDNLFSFPSVMVKAGQESLEFACIRSVKEFTGIRLLREDLIPIDFRSSPERSCEGNVVDMGFLVMSDKINIDEGLKCIDGLYKPTWKTIDFEKNTLCDLEHNSKQFVMDHSILLKRAIGLILMIKE